MIDIKGLDKAEILAALYNNPVPQGLGKFFADDKRMTTEEARSLLKEQTYFDYVKGRVMKVRLEGDTLDTRLYNRDLGVGAAERVIASIRKRNQ